MKITCFLVVVIFCNACLAAPPVNEKYSYQDFSGKNFKGASINEFNDMTIIGSAFYQEWREGDKEIAKDIFPEGMKGVLFERCNLDNVLVPSGNTILDGTNKRIKVQNDLDDWFVDNTGKPLEPLNKNLRITRAISIKPEDIPIQKFTAEQRAAFEAKFAEPEIIVAESELELVYIVAGIAAALGLGGAGYYYVRKK